MPNRRNPDDLPADDVVAHTTEAEIREKDLEENEPVDEARPGDDKNAPGFVKSRAL